MKRIGHAAANVALPKEVYKPDVGLEWWHMAIATVQINTTYKYQPLRVGSIRLSGVLISEAT